MVVRVPMRRDRCSSPVFSLLTPTPSTRPRALLTLETLIGSMAVPCGIGLVVYGLGISQDQLEGTPFDSFLVPGLLLSGVVGGSMWIAAWAVWRRKPAAPLLSLAAGAVLWRRKPAAPLLSLAAGAVLLGWISVEALMIYEGRPLQLFIFSCAMLTLWLAWRYRHQAS